MRYYLTKTPRILKAVYHSCVWSVPNENKTIYLTFDDGPCENITDFVLDELEKHQAQATFFCIGKNIEQYPAIFKRIKERGHSIGNHTHNHLNGWKVNNIEYFKNINAAQKLIGSNLFRPPYGRIKPSQIRGIKRLHPKINIIMWDVLSGDFDTQLSPEACYEIVVKDTKPGSIIVFHDSVKAFDRLQYVLPRFLAYCKNKGWEMKALQ